MKITEIVVQAGCTFNVPHEQFANNRPAIEIRASIEAGDDPEAVARLLRDRAEALLAEHKGLLIASASAAFEQARMKKAAAKPIAATAP